MTRPDCNPALFAPGPARDPRFRVVDQWIDCSNLPDDDPRHYVEFLHRQMNEEVNGLENAARNLADFPDAEWEVRMSIARQCSDEARHVLMFRRVLEARGGAVGEAPVLNFQYRIITRIDNLVGRLTVQNRAFEASGVDAVEPEIERTRREGDLESAALYEAQLADEICHVRFANQYINEAVRRDPRNVMRTARAMHDAVVAFGMVMGPEAMSGLNYQVNRAGRLEAGFSPGEVAASEAANAARRKGA